MKCKIFLRTIILCALCALSLTAFGTQQNILIYSGPGAGPKSVANTLAIVKQLVGTKYNVITVGPEIIIENNWQHDTALLIMPGGADRPYLEKLAGPGNRNIRSFVQNGGRFLGICAGAYYSADRIEFAKGNSDLEVTGERELKFFPGLVSGPTYAGFDHRDLHVHDGARAAILHWQLAQPFKRNQKFIVFYNGGGSFIAPEQYPNVTVLARYSPEVPDDKSYPAAIVECAVGDGTAILSGAHFEWDPSTFDPDSKQLLEIQPILVAENSNRIALAKHLLERLGVY